VRRPLRRSRLSTRRSKLRSGHPRMRQLSRRDGDRLLHGVRPRPIVQPLRASSQKAPSGGATDGLRRGASHQEPIVAPTAKLVIFGDPGSSSSIRTFDVPTDNGAFVTLTTRSSPRVTPELVVRPPTCRTAGGCPSKNVACAALGRHLLPLPQLRPRGDEDVGPSRARFDVGKCQQRFRPATDRNTARSFPGAGITGFGRRPFRWPEAARGTSGSATARHA
jgi:hypothetical protein